MNKPTHAAIAAMAVFALAACQAHAEKTATPKPDRATQCQQFATSQFKPQLAVSGTSFTSTYNDITGFCTVKVENKTPGSVFSSRISTNEFDPSRTTIHFETTTEPVRIQWQQAPRPHHLLCKSVTAGRDGKLVCDPYHQTEDDFFTPFMPFDSDF